MAHAAFSTHKTGAVFDEYLKGLHEDMQKDFPGLTYWKKSTREMESYTIRGSIGYIRNASATSANIDGGAIGDRGSRRYAEAYFSPGFDTVGLGISDLMVKMADKSQRYFDIIANQFEDAEYVLRKLNSIEARTFGVGAVGSITDASPASGSPASNKTVDSARFLLEGKTYDTVTASTAGNASPTVTGTITISAVNKDGTINYTYTGTPAQYDLIVLHGMANSANNPMGFMGAADDATLLHTSGTYGGLVPATYGRYWVGNMDFSASRTVEATPIFEMCSKIDKRCGKPVTHMLCSPEFVRDLSLQFNNDMRFTFDSIAQKKIGTGWSKEGATLVAGGQPLTCIVDPDQTGPSFYVAGSYYPLVGTVLLWNEDAPEYFEAFPPQWRGLEMGDSSRALRTSSTNYEYVGELIYGWTLATFKRSGLGVVAGFNVTDSCKL